MTPEEQINIRDIILRNEERLSKPLPPNPYYKDEETEKKEIQEHIKKLEVKLKHEQAYTKA